MLVLLLLLLLLLLLFGPFFEEGMRFFSPGYGTPSSFWPLPSSPLDCWVWAGLDPGPWPPLLCWLCWWWWPLRPPLLLLLFVVVGWRSFFFVFRALGAKLGDVANLLTPPAPGASSLHQHNHLPIPADYRFRGWLWSHPLLGTAGRHSPRRLSRPGIWGGWTPQPGQRHLSMLPGPPQ